MALLPGSPALDAGSSSIPGVTVPATDQRGAVRGPAGLSAGSAPDIGAFEVSSSAVIPATATPAQVQNFLRTAAPAGGPVTLLPTSNTALSASVRAVNALTNPLNVTIDLGGGTFITDTHIAAQSGVTITIVNGTLVAGSMALVVDTGAVVLDHVAATNATNAPTIVVNGGSLTVRNSTIQESTGFAQTALVVNGGSVDLGTAPDPGNNVVNVNGAGDWIGNPSGRPISIVGVTYEIDGVPLASSLSGVVFADLNNDGRLESGSGETGIAGVTVSLDGTDFLNNAVHLAQVTDANGAYVFQNLRPGTYTITEAPPSGYLDGRDSVGTVGGTPDGTAANDQFSQIVLSTKSISNGVNYNFGELPFTTTSQHSLISSNYNDTAIAAGNTVWFSSIFTASGLSATKPVTVRFVDQEIKFTVNGTAYDVLVPNAVVTFSPATKTATTTYDIATQTWVTNVPSTGLAGNIFLSGLGFAAPAGGLPGGIKSVTWEGDFLTDTPGVRINWQWAAAVYDNTKAPAPFPSGFSVDYNPVAVKPVDDHKASVYQNADHAGTPENYKPYVIKGATGNGGANDTGDLSPPASVTAPLIIPNLGVLDPTASFDSAPWWAKRPKK
jgi:hypothetical protein